MSAPESEVERLAEVIAGIDGGRLADASARAHDACLRAARALLASDWLAFDRARVAAEAWDECIEALVWCLDNGSPASAPGYLHANNPHRARADRLSEGACACPPCPGRGSDGHGMNHCAECCFGSGVEVDIACPTHGEGA